MTCPEGQAEKRKSKAMPKLQVNNLPVEMASCVADRMTKVFKIVKV